MVIGPRAPEPAEVAIGESQNLITRKKHINHLRRLDGLHQGEFGSTPGGERTHKLVRGDPKVRLRCHIEEGRRVRLEGSAEVPHYPLGRVAPPHGDLNGSDVLGTRRTAKVHAIHPMPALKDPRGVSRRRLVNRQGRDPVGLASGATSERIKPEEERGLVAAAGNDVAGRCDSRVRGDRSPPTTTHSRGT
jgi:hypothetical protein